MKKFLASAAAVALCAGGATAGGIDRTLNPYGVLFEDGDYVEFSFSNVTPSVSGDYPATSPGGAATGGGSTGNMANSYSQLSMAYKNDLSETLSLGLFLNQPYGADAQYTGGFYDGLQAEWESDQIAAVMRYKFNGNWSVYGGLRSVYSNAQINIPDNLPRDGFTVAEGQVAAGITALQALPSTPAIDAQIAALQTQQAQLNALIGAPVGTLDYTAVGAGDRSTGGIVGIAYERPEIALRVALTYESAITHRIPTEETWTAPFGPGVTLDTVTEIEMPASLKLDFQSGVAQNTLVFGSIRYAEWTQWAVAPPGYFGVTGSNVVDFSNDTTTYQLGVAQRFSEAVSGFFRVTYEKSNGGISSRLAPTDGSTGYGIGIRYTRDNVVLTTGIEYVDVGDAVDATGTQFTGNDALGIGMTVGVKF